MLPTHTHRDGTKPRRLAVTAAVTLVLVLLVACGDDHAPSDRDGTPHIPSQGDPAFGTAGNALISDRLSSVDASLDQLWIGFNDREGWDAFVALNERLRGMGSLPWVGGHLVASASHPLGFYFDPATTGAAEVVAETYQTALDALKRDPQAAERDQPGRWVVAATVERLVPAGE